MYLLIKNGKFWLLLLKNKKNPNYKWMFFFSSIIAGHKTPVTFLNGLVPRKQILNITVYNTSRFFPSLYRITNQLSKKWYWNVSRNVQSTLFRTFIIFIVISAIHCVLLKIVLRSILNRNCCKQLISCMYNWSLS